MRVGKVDEKIGEHIGKVRNIYMPCTSNSDYHPCHPYHYRYHTYHPYPYHRYHP